MRPDRRLLASGHVARVALAAAVAIGAGGAALAVAQAWLLAHTIAGAFLGGRDVAALAGPILALALVLAARSGLAWAAEVAAQRISGTVRSDLRRRLLAAAVALGPRDATEARSGEVALLATRGLDALDPYFGRYLPQVALAAIVPLVVVACLLAVDLVAALTVALTVPLIPLFMVLIGRMSVATRRRRWRALSRLAGRFLDVVTGLPTLRAYGAAGAQVAALRRVTDAYRIETIATLRVAFLSALALELLATLSVALVAVGVGLRLAAGQLALETGLFALVLAPEAYLPLRRLGAEFHASEEGRTAAARAFAIIDAPVPPAGARGDVPSLVGSRLVVEGVSVRQPGRDLEAPAEASLVLRPGEVVSVTGPSGAGKSTLVAVLLGLLPPTSGSVRLVAADGTVTDLTDLDGDAWRRRIAWLPQVPYLFPGTVEANVRLARSDATPSAVRAALAAVGLGWLDPDRALGEAGAGLSSGERRRTGLARALLRESPILLLDEPTAGLDAASEATVLAAIRAAADRGAAVLVVAHRPAAAAAADRVVSIRWRAVDPSSAPSPVGELEAVGSSGGPSGSVATVGSLS